MEMTIETRRTCVSESLNYEDRDAYISGMALSSIWGDSEDADIPTDRVSELGRIWDRTHRDIRGIRDASGMTFRDLAQRFCIPSRTMDSWSMGERKPPLYTLLMMQEILDI